MDVFFVPEYAQLYKEIIGLSETFSFTCEHGTIQHTFIMREIPWKIDGITYYDITTPYGYGGPIVIECKDIHLLIQSYKNAFTQYCLDKRIVCEFIRFHLFDNTDIRDNYYGEKQVVLDNVVVNTNGTFNDIWMGYEYKVRKNVRKAVNNQLEIEITPELTRLDDFLNIYYATMRRNAASPFYYFERNFFENIAATLSDNYLYFYVLHDGDVISAELILYSSQYAYSFLGGTDDAYYSYRPNDFLKNEILRWCNQTGCQKFILGGGYHNSDGIYRYKRGFSSSPDVPFYIGRYVFSPDIYNVFVECKKQDDPNLNLQASFFPLYRV